MIWRIRRSPARELASRTISKTTCMLYNPKHTIVPYVISPTRAYCGSRLKLMMIESLSAFKLSSSWHVSTTNRKMGGFSTGRGSRYSIVVLLACSSGGICCSEMSL